MSLPIGPLRATKFDSLRFAINDSNTTDAKQASIEDIRHSARAVIDFDQ